MLRAFKKISSLRGRFWFFLSYSFNVPAFMSYLYYFRRNFALGVAVLTAEVFHRLRF